VHPLRLRLAETSDLMLLRVLLREIGKGQADKVLAVDVQRRGADPDRDPVLIAGDQFGFVGPGAGGVPAGRSERVLTVTDDVRRNR
jgi:hypothetical protein